MVTGSTLTMKGGRIGGVTEPTNGNTAKTAGGGIYASNSTVTINAGDVCSNKSSTNGGGIYFNGESGTAALSIDGECRINDNTAQKSGGGIYATGATATVTLAKDSSSAVSAYVQGNTATSENGGGVYFTMNARGADTNVAFTTSGNTITYNSASVNGGGIFSNAMKPGVIIQDTITNNSANSGGGICVNSGNLTYNGTNPITQNTATAKGGAAYVLSTANFNGTTINNNTVTAGGGGGIFVEVSGSATVTNGTITDNHAKGTNNTLTTAYQVSDYTGIGGGICVGKGTSADSKATFSMTGSIYGNTATFAGDDVASTGSNTDLDIPEYSEMNVDGYRGWYEDYPNNDASYTLGTNLDTSGVGSRYKTGTPVHSRKYLIENLDTSSNNALAVNDTDSYVCMTLGTSGISVSFKYYGRDITDGVPADINKKETVYTVSYPWEKCTEYLNNDTLNIKGIITNAGVKFGDTYNNIVDQYYLWDSQSAAVSGVKDINQNLRDYTGKDLTYHTDRYGRVQGEGEVNDSEKWVTYYYNDAEVLYEDDNNLGNTVTDIVVWLYNTPKKYTVRTYVANSGDQLTANSSGNYVAANNSYKNTSVYYNQRLGNEIDGNADSGIDSATTHLNAYGISGYIGYEANTASVINEQGTAIKFVYWSFDSNGETVASTEFRYNYRITGDTNLYAVYKENPSTEPGITITYSDSDLYFDANGVSRTRLNTVMSPYNCVDNDSNIEIISVIYVVTESGTHVSVDKMSEEIKAKIIENVANNKTSFKLTDSDSTDVYYVYTDFTLSNKNRAQFSGSFKTSSLANKNVAVFAAMYYQGKGWIVSDNCVEYQFDSNGACKSTSF